MCFGQIDYIDEVADTRTVGSIIIVTKHAQFLTDADSGLGKIRNQVLRYTVRQLSQQCCGVCTYRVEVTQQDGVYRSTGSNRITYNLFIDLLRVSIRRLSFLNRCLFRYRKFVRLAVNCAGRREYDTFHSMLRHQFQQVYQ